MSNGERLLRMTIEPDSRDAVLCTDDDLSPEYAVAFKLVEDHDENWRRAQAAVRQIRKWLGIDESL